MYRKLVELHLKVHALTMTFPKFEMYELGSQLRSSSNSAPANPAKGWNNRHLNIYLEGTNRALGEMGETKHHLAMALSKKYLTEEIHQELINGYEECGRMLRGLEQSLEKFKH